MAERPLSPFWVYRWTYTNSLSILHRIAGVALVLALLGLVVWLISASFGEAAYREFLPIFTSGPSKFLISLALFALIYHFCNGLRHLAWDIGWGFERAAARRSAVLVLAGTAIGGAICSYFILFRGVLGGP